MYLEHLRLYNFRNFKDFRCSFGPGINSIIGANGQGKTNLVEAINLLSATKSFRTAKLSELVRWRESEASVFGRVLQDISDVELGLSIQNGRRQVYINGDRQTSAIGFIGKLLCVTFSPSDLDLVKGGPGPRRKFVDRHMVDLEPPRLNDLLQYQRALSSKQKLLKSGRADERQLGPWNEIMAVTGAKITEARADFLMELEAAANVSLQHFAGQDGPLRLRLSGEMLKQEIHGQAGLLALFERHMRRELAVKKTCVGPHCDEILIELGDRPARAFASQGQTRGIVLALKLGVLALLEERYRDAPVVLLDDLDSELDSARTRALYELIIGGNRQVFLTGTDRAFELLAGRESVRQFELAQGVLRERN